MSIADHKAVQEALQRAQEQRLCQRLAQALVIRLRIVPGNWLGPLLSAPDAANNEAAVAAWVARYLYACREETFEQTLQALSCRLSRVLSRLNDD